MSSIVRRIVGWIRGPVVLGWDRVVAQSGELTCGAAAIATILREVFDAEIDESRIVSQLGSDSEVSMDDLAIVAKMLGCDVEGYALDFDALCNFRTPCVVYMARKTRGHFAVLRGIGRNEVWLADPAVGNVFMCHNKFRRLWEGERDEGKILLLTRCQDGAPCGGNSVNVGSRVRGIVDLFPVHKAKKNGAGAPFKFAT